MSSSDPQLTHHIQLAILRAMLTRPQTRYSELKPPAVEANLFMYHLKQLIRLGLIEKQGTAYALTRPGKRFADRATLETMKINIQPKVITILCVRRADGQWLLLKRKHQPFLGHKGFPSGKVHFGETLLQAAERDLQEKAGLTGVAMTLRGNTIMRFTDKGEPINHIIGYVLYGEVPVSTIVDLKHEHYESYFAPESELFVEPCYKGHQEILDYLKRDDGLFLFEAEFQSDY